jgi:hypothetical protein
MLSNYVFAEEKLQKRLETACKCVPPAMPMVVPR